LKVDFDLNDTSKPKPVAGSDDLLLLLVQLWARDKSIFLTKENRLDLATIVLFNAYTGGRPAEFIHASKGKASQDPYREAEATSKQEHLDNIAEKDYNNERDTNDKSEHDASNEPEHNRHALFNNNNKKDSINYDSPNDDMMPRAGTNSGYYTKDIDNPINEENCPAIGVNDSGQPVKPINATELDKFGEIRRKYKALCYENICL
jgi:hypothetical protein